MIWSDSGAPQYSGTTWTFNTGLSLPPGDYTITASYTDTLKNGRERTISSEPFSFTIESQNAPATIAGDLSADVFEDSGGTGSGSVSVTDPDPGEGALLAVAAGTRSDGGFGTIQVLASGAWTYSLDNSLDAVQALADGETLNDTFTITSADGSASETVSVTIHGTNDAPVAGDDSVTVAAGSSTLLDVLANDGDVDGTTLTLLAIVALPAHGEATIENGQVRYVPDPGYDGPDSLSYRVGDGSGGLAEATVAIEVQAPTTADTTAPTATIALSSPASADEALIVIVTYQDETKLDGTTISLQDLGISTAGPGIEILSQSLDFSTDGRSAYATYGVLPQGGWTGDDVFFSVAASSFGDAAGNTNAAVAASFAYNDAFTGITPVDPVDPGLDGTVKIKITPNSGIQKSSYQNNSFSVENFGDKRIAAIYFDITGALLTDAVFDPLGLAGDSVSRGLFYGDTGGTGAVVVGYQKTDPDVLDPFFGAGGTAGYEGMLLRFDSTVDGGFQTGERVLFGVDLDPNSIAGLPQQPLDIDGQDPRLNTWDMGGVSGAELMGATITVLFTDGTRASGQLISDGSQGGAVALVNQAAPGLEVDLTVNGVPEGGSGTYGGGESVIIVGPAGETARVVLTMGFSQPFDYTDPNGAVISVEDRLAAANDPFGANNALKVQAVDVLLTGAPQDITALFDFNPPGGSLDFVGNDALPIAFVASVVDKFGQPLGDVTAPIYLAKEGGVPPGSHGADSLAEMTQLALQGVNLNNPTSIDVGADGRLYVSQQNGLIVALTIARTTSTDSQGVTTTTWSVTDREDITLVKDMPNHNDQGVYQPGVSNRQVTGIATAVDENGRVVIYVTSSDPRIGGGGSGQELNLDTNSGIISRLQQVDDGSGNLVWQKVDLVRGLPRSEENHSLNGLEFAIGPDGHAMLVVTVGGNTNLGAQSNNFAYTPEYYYSGSIVTVDLTLLAQLEASQGLRTYSPAGRPAQFYLYDLPTLDDPTRANAAGGDLAGDGSQTADVFGGNDGLNQAIFDPNGIVRFNSVGFRNAYDVVVTQSGAVYTIDNGSNSGWGGTTVNLSGQILVDLNGDGIADNGPGVNLPNELGPQNNADGLHRVDDSFALPDAQVYYAGHPNLYRAYGADAGFYLYASPGNPWGVAGGTPLEIVNGTLKPASAPVDLGPWIANAGALAGSATDSRQAVLSAIGERTAGLTDAPNGALYTWYSSTNGITEYTAGGGLAGQILTVSFDGKIYAVKLGAGGEVAGVEERALTSSPLDLVAQGDQDPYPGVIFVAAYGADQIVILSPDQSQGVTPDPNDRDQDGIDDTIDAFAADPDNGMVDVVEPGAVLRWSFVNGESFPNDRPSIFDGTGGLFPGGDIGFTGVMTNHGGLPESLYRQENIIWGGAPGILQVKSVDPGDATTDEQRNGFQLGFTLAPGLETFAVSSLIDNFLDEIGTIPGDEKLSQGIFIGAGDQNNFVSVSLVRLADGRSGFEVVSQFAFAFSGETQPQIQFYEVPGLASAGSLDTVTLDLEVAVASAAVTPSWTYALGGVVSSGAGAPVILQGDALAALRGTLTLPDGSGGQVSTGLAAGVVSSRSGGTAGEVISAFSAGGDESFSAVIDGTAVTFVPDSGAPGVTIVGNTKISGTSESIDFLKTSLDELYTEERYGADSNDWGYAIATGNGTFDVDLFFAEAWSGAFAEGARIFDVLLEGAIVSDNFDIYKSAGGSNTEIVISSTATVTDGVLDIAFSKEVQNAKVNGVLVREAGNAGVFAADWDDLEIRGSGDTIPTQDTFVFGVNAGGPKVMTTGGLTYQSDTFGAGRSYSTSSPIAGTVDDALYQTENWQAGGFTYDIPVDNGTYRVELNLAEIYPGTYGPGGRVFDIWLEGQRVFDDLDTVVAAGGPLTALVLEAIVEVTDGSFTLATTPEVQNPKINAFSLWTDDLLV